MKAERRHELQHNVLDHELAKVLMFFRKQGGKLLWIVIIVLFVLAAGLYVYNRRQARRLAPQRDYDLLAMNSQISPDERIKQLKELAEQNNNEHIAALACADLGDQYANRWFDGLKELGEDELSQLYQQAEKFYQKLISEHSQDLIPVARARLGLARLAISKSNFEEAKVQYQAVLKINNLEGYAIREEAVRGLDVLADYEKQVRMAASAPATQPAATDK